MHVTIHFNLGFLLIVEKQIADEGVSRKLLILCFIFQKVNFGRNESKVIHSYYYVSQNSVAKPSRP